MANENDEQAGVKAIIALQALIGIEETEEQAKLGWANMSAHEKESTIQIHKRLCTK